MPTQAPPVRPEVKPRTHGAPQPKEPNKPRWATAAGSTDAFCHWYVNRGRTLCGITHDPLPRDSMHREAPCPNGNPPCPACVKAYQNNGN